MNRNPYQPVISNASPHTPLRPSTPQQVAELPLYIGVLAIVMPLVILISMVGYRKYQKRQFQRQIEMLESLWAKSSTENQR